VERSDTLLVQVNLSAIELEHPDLIPAITDVLRRTGIDPGRLVLEVTETLLVKDAERGAATLQQLRDLGVQLALDDFGTGYSSLSYLKRFPVDMVKIDQSFVTDIAGGPVDEAIVTAVVALAHAIGMSVVAEGVEEPHQRVAITKLGCDMAQGFLFAHPMSATDIDGALQPQAR